MKFSKISPFSFQASICLTMVLGFFQVIGFAQFQNFNGVTAPALPAGWTSVQTTNTGINWITTATNPNSAPNAAFANETSSINAAALVSPAVIVNSNSASIGFWNRFNLEDSTNAGVGFDGTVLELSTNGGTIWTDIIAGGGSFVSGGYTDTIATGFQSPIPGRMAWSGNSAGYIHTIVNLPASLNGQSVQFRWRTASDSSAIASSGAPGQWVDDVQIVGITTAANVSISGRVLSGKSAIVRAIAALTDSSGATRTVKTNTFGCFRFDGVRAGETVIIQVTAKGLSFAPQILSVSEDLTDFDFNALE